VLGEYNADMALCPVIEKGGVIKKFGKTIRKIGHVLSKSIDSNESPDSLAKPSFSHPYSTFLLDNYTYRAHRHAKCSLDTSR